MAWRTFFFLAVLLIYADSINSYGTITAKRYFDAGLAAKHLKEATTGWGTDEDTIIKIFTQHNFEQRRKIAIEYEKQYHQVLVDVILRETSGCLEDGLVGLLVRPLELGAHFIHEAVKGLGTNEDTLTAILLSLDNGEMSVFKEIYKKDHGNALGKDIADDVSEYLYEDFLLTLVDYDRNQYGRIDYKLAQEDALHLAGRGSKAPIAHDFNAIFASRSYEQLNLTFYAFESHTGYSILQEIENRFKENHKQALEAVVLRAYSAIGYYTFWLHKSMKILGTNEDLLTWVIVTRSEIDLAEIEKEYDHTYGSLVEKIKDETSSYYEKLLLSILNPPKND